MDVRNAIDELMELAIVPSFTDVGLHVRRRLLDWEDLDTVRMDGRTVLVTGSTSGLGFAAARRLAGMGATVRLLGRNERKVERAIEAIREHVSGADVRATIADMSDLSSVRRAADDILRSDDRLDVLVNNAGALLTERQTSVDGFEMSFATMVLGPFVLTNALAPLMERSARTRLPSRVINVVSGGMYTQGLRLDDLQMEREPYRGAVAYARAKRALVVLTGIWAERLRPRGIKVDAMHPGWADTPGISASLPSFSRLVGRWLRSPEEGADTIVWLAASDEAARWTGHFWHDRRPRATERLPGTATSAVDAARLWAACEVLTSPRTEPTND